MILSPPPDSVIVAVFLFSVVGGILAFVVTVLLEAAIFCFLGWAGKLGSLLLSLVINLVSTVLGWISVIFGLVSLDGLSESILPWIVLCVLSTMIEGTLCVLQVKRVGDALQGCLIANVASYLLLMLFYLLISGGF